MKDEYNNKLLLNELHEKRNLKILFLGNILHNHEMIKNFINKCGHRIFCLKSGHAAPPEDLKSQFDTVVVA